MCVQLHGELPKSLERWCAQKRESVSFLHAYDYMPPEPVVLEQLVTEVCTGSVDAVAFTSAQQPRFLFRYASQTGADGDLVAGFEKVVAAGVGKVTAEALREHGVTRVVAPEQEPDGGHDHRTSALLRRAGDGGDVTASPRLATAIYSPP